MPIRRRKGGHELAKWLIHAHALGVPLDTNGEAVVGAVDCFDDAVQRPTEGLQRSGIRDGLVMRAVDVDDGWQAFENGSIETHPMRRMGGILPLFVIHCVGVLREVLDQRAARRDRHHLHAAAQAKEGYVFDEAMARGGELETSSRSVDRIQSSRDRLAVV